MAALPTKKNLITGIVFFTLLMCCSIGHSKNHTLSKPAYDSRLGKIKLTNSHKNFKDDGAIIISIAVGHSLDYNLWDGISLYQIKNKKIYHIDVHSCAPSACTFIGRIPKGEYFIEQLFRFYTSKGSQMISRLPIRNTLSSFKVKAKHINDLGIVGFYGIVKKTASESLLTQHAYLKNFAEAHAYIFNTDYRTMLEVNPLPTNDTDIWIDQNWLKDLNSVAEDTNSFYTDKYKIYQGKDDSIYFLGKLGMIHQFSPQKKFIMHNTGTTNTIHSMIETNNGMFAGGERGLMLTSLDKGHTWSTFKQINHDKTYAGLLKHNTFYSTITIDSEMYVSIYQAKTMQAPFKKITSYRIDFPNKAFTGLHKLSGRIPSLTSISLNRQDLYRLDLTPWQDEIHLQTKNRRIDIIDRQEKNISSDKLPFSATNIINASDARYAIENIKNSDLHIVEYARLIKTLNIEKNSPLAQRTTKPIYPLAKIHTQDLTSQTWSKLTTIPGKWVSNMLLLEENKAAILHSITINEVKNTKLTIIDLKTGEYSRVGNDPKLSNLNYIELRKFQNGIIAINKLNPNVHYTKDHGVTWDTYGLINFLKRNQDNTNKDKSNEAI